MCHDNDSFQLLKSIKLIHHCQERQRNSRSCCEVRSRFCAFGSGSKRTMTRGSSYTVTAPNGGVGYPTAQNPAGNYPGDNNHAYQQQQQSSNHRGSQEMSEFSTNGNGQHRGSAGVGSNGSGTYNKNGGLKAVTPPQYAYGNGGYPQPASAGNQVVPKMNSRAVEDEDEVEERGQWGSKAEFILSCIGFSVGIGNVWRFPYLAYQNGGGAFLFPYMILLIFVGKPMYYMETAIGQFARVSPLQLWECAPIAKGVGFGMIVVSLIVSIYYNVIMSYAIIYMGASFVGTTAPLPWSTCTNEWNNNTWAGKDPRYKCIVTTNTTELAKDIDELSKTVGNATKGVEGSGDIAQVNGPNKNLTNILSLERCRPHLNIDPVYFKANNIYATHKNGTVKGEIMLAENGTWVLKPGTEILRDCTFVESSAVQYWERYVLRQTNQLSDVPGDLGGFDYKIPLALLLSWIVVFLCLCKGVKSSGKVVYFTATFPYLILIALLVNGVMLDGAMDGLYYLFVPKWDQLLNVVVWRKAAEQMFFSLGISWGGLIMFGSYNKFHNKIHIDASVVSTLDFLTSIIASVVIFSVLGFMAKRLGVEVEHVAEGGQGLAFVAYPEALSQLPFAWLWSVLFFFMLFLLGLDSEFALLETALTAMYDGFPKIRKYKVSITAASCLACFLLGLPCASNSGQYILDLMDTYGAGFAVLWIGIWELIGLMWIYGYKNVSKDIELMLGHEPCWFWKLCWGFISPVFLVIIFILAVYGWKDPLYSGVIPYPGWAHIIGWVLVGISAIQIPAWAIIMTIYHAAKGRVSQVIKPTHKWGPGDPVVRREILDQQNGIQRNGKHSYDNQAMGYDGYHM